MAKIKAKVMTFTSKEETLINYLLIFYKNRIELFRDIIYQKTPLSLRLLDWLVTNYSKKYNIVYQLNNILNETYIFNIYLDYKNQLKAYSKKFFDPFCRQKRIIIDSSTMKWVEYHDSYKDCDKKFIVTTVGQLNFFRWFIENKILEYAERVSARRRLKAHRILCSIAQRSRNKVYIRPPSHNWYCH